MKRYIISLIIFTILSVGVADAYEATPYLTDTLQRELVLQKDYVPTGHQATRATFNPLDTRGKASLTPIEFAKNTYIVGMNVTPRLFDPIQNPLAPDYPRQVFHARLFGGYPIYAGGNVAFQGKVGETGSILLGIDHISRINKVSSDLIPFDAQNITHDTEAKLNYTHALEERLLNVGVEVFNHLNTFYGHTTNLHNTTGQNSLLTGDEDFEASYNLFRLTGGDLTLSLSPAPLAFRSGWQYSATANIGIANKKDPIHMDHRSPIISYNGDGSVMNEKCSLNELSVDLVGNLGYTFAGTDWGAGIDGAYQFISISELKIAENITPPQLLSIDPYVQYNSPYLKIKGGVKIQLLNRGEKTLLITPDVEFRWKASPHFSLYAIADGGGEYMSMRDIYQVNRYAETASVYMGYNITKYRALLGLQLGNFNGFSVDLYGGYADLLAFSDWDTHYFTAPTHPTITHDPFNFVLFKKVNKGRADHIFTSIMARYVSYYGLDLSAAFKYNKYTLKGLEEGQVRRPISGLPNTEINLRADYNITDKLSAGITYNGMGGIEFYHGTIDAYEEYHMPFINEVDARISYKLHKNIGITLMGKNILNSKSTRWLSYERPGATIVGAVTISL